MPTHGSLTKAGKVRAQTPQIEGEEKESPAPRMRNRRNYINRIVNSSNRRGYRR